MAKVLHWTRPPCETVLELIPLAARFRGHFMSCIRPVRPGRFEANPIALREPLLRPAKSDAMKKVPHWPRPPCETLLDLVALAYEFRSRFTSSIGVNPFHWSNGYRMPQCRRQAMVA